MAPEGEVHRKRLYRRRLARAKSKGLATKSIIKPLGCSAGCKYSGSERGGVASRKKDAAPRAHDMCTLQQSDGLLSSAVSVERSMVRLHLLFALTVAIWGVFPTESFSCVPGARRHRSSSLVDFARNARRGCALRAAPSKSTAVTESADYLENKEALKKVCVISPMHSSGTAHSDKLLCCC